MRGRVVGEGRAGLTHIPFEGFGSVVPHPSPGGEIMASNEPTIWGCSVNSARPDAGGHAEGSLGQCVMCTMHP